jgi:hypothetical protein
MAFYMNRLFSNNPERRTFMKISRTFIITMCLIGLLLSCQTKDSDKQNSQDTAVPTHHPENLNGDLQSLADSFFQWRMITQPITSDDVPRVQRPDNWVPDYSPENLQAMRARYRNFKERLNQLPRSGWTRADSIDYLLLRSAVERVHWELDVLRLPHTNPDFYVQQTLGAFYDLLIIGSPINHDRIKNMIVRLRSIPVTLEHAGLNLTDPVLSFAGNALANLENIREKMDATLQALESFASPELYSELRETGNKAADGLEAFALWLKQKQPSMQKDFQVGEKGYAYFLKEIALIPHTPEELLMQGRMAWNRAVTFETMERNRNRHLPGLALFPSIKTMIQRSERDEKAIRFFLEKNDLMTVPDWLSHYTLREIPGWIRPLSYIGGAYDVTWETRLTEDAVRYIPKPSLQLPYFFLSMAKDPRPIIIHEGIPGHYFQMAISWRHPDPIRRRYIDSGSNEGIGFYVEEMLLQAGMFDNLPHVREILYNFMRLRALRVEVDIQLALGNFTLEQAASYLERTVPMDHAAAREEAGFFASTPGQAITYQIGKLQILRFLADSRTVMKDDFNLREFHDRLILHGNVPIALQRWEYLGLRDEINHLW